MVLQKPSDRPTPFAKGSLAERPLAHLLVYVLDRRLSGSFELLGESGRQTHIVVDQGMIARVAISEPVAYLGLVLYEMGTIDGAQLGQSLAEVANAKELHGQVLLARKMIDSEGLAEGLRRQRARKLHYAFGLSPQTSFAFYPAIDLVGERPNDVEAMDPLPSIWRGVLLHPSWDHVHSTLTTVGDRPLRLVGAIERLRLDGKELETVERLRGSPKSAKEMASLAGLDARIAELLAYFLVISKMVELGRQPEAAGTSMPPSSPLPAPATMFGAGPRPSAHPSGQYHRPLSFTMRAVRTDREPLRIPSPIPRSAGTPKPSDPPRSSRKPSVPAALTTSAPSSRPGSMRAPQSVAAAHSLSQAEMHVVLGENGQALTSARQALEQDRDFPEAMALVAYLEAIGADAETTTYIQDSLNLVNSAIRKKDTCKRAYYYRAEIKKLLEDHEGAIADLDVAVAQDPNDVDARRELRVYEQKVKDGSIKLGGSPDSQKSSKGFFDRLRGK